MFNEKIFSQRLAALRLKKDITLKQLGIELNVSKQAVGHWETGFRTPPLEKAYALADYFDVSLDYLVGRSDDPTRR